MNKEEILVSAEGNTYISDLYSQNKLNIEYESQEQYNDEVQKLQKENNKLKEIEKEHKKINGELREENRSLKSQLDFIDEQNRYIKRLEKRIDKAIEIAKEKIKRYESYINDLKNGNYPSPTIRQERQELIFRIREQEELLETLKGEENEE